MREVLGRQLRQQFRQQFRLAAISARSNFGPRAAHAHKTHAYRTPAHKVSHPSSPTEDQEEGDTTMLKQPETRAITQDQLVNEVKGIYAGLVMVEKKCVEAELFMMVVV